MQSNISKELDMNFPPIVLLKSDTELADCTGGTDADGGISAQDAGVFHALCNRLDYCGDCESVGALF